MSRVKTILFFFFFFSTIAFSSSQTVSMKMNMREDGAIKAVLFDTFGTVVDWHGTMVQEFGVLFNQKNITSVDCEQFVDAWVTSYAENMSDIAEGRAPFLTVDALNKMALDELLERYQITSYFTENERHHMWMIWHRLKAWPDSVSGLRALKKRFIIGTLSNGNVKMLVDLSKKENLDWDVIFSGELFGHYKPDPVVYQSAVKMLNLKPSEILLVASHRYDLEAARQLGFKTAYIFRPLEYGVSKEVKMPHDDEFDFVAIGIDELAEKLEANSSR
ncbi:MAG: haloacid dehalogenase type II [Gammaproteobacteria bacterium]|nr:haloacid dehalogenase type II [Gammaproteobacteria bacterium]